MDLKQTPFLIGAASVALLLARGLAPAPVVQVPPHPAAPDAGAASAEPAPADDGTTGSAYRDYARLYREQLEIAPPKARPHDVLELHGSVGGEPVRLDLSPEPSEPPGGAWESIALAARDHRLRLEYMMVLVADPVESGLAADFDLELRAVQSALADASYQLDRNWLPWTQSKALDEKAYQDAAGMLLFRRTGNDRRGSLLAVFLVGETPKQGIHKRAFHSAVSFIAGLHAAACRADLDLGHPTTAAASACTDRVELPVLGPTYSGAADSLRLAIDNAPPDVCFRLVSGSAAAPRVEQALADITGPSRVLFSRTIVDEETLIETALRFLQDKMGWNLDRAVLLVENDTTYGNSLWSSTQAAPLLRRLTKVRFPTELYGLRNAWAATTAAGQPAAAGEGTSARAVSAPKTALDVSLADRQPPVDVIAEQSPLATRIYDVTIANVGRQLSRERFSYVGIVATDVKDELFLAEQVRRWIPGASLFVFEADLLYVHPQYNQAMFGTLAISSFPMVTEGGGGIPSPATPDPTVRRQFASELQEGVYLAAGELMGRPTPAPSVWIAASGNYGMWPLRAEEPDAAGALPPIDGDVRHGDRGLRTDGARPGAEHHRQDHRRCYYFQLVLLVEDPHLWPGAAARPGSKPVPSDGAAGG